MTEIFGKLNKIPKSYSAVYVIHKMSTAMQDCYVKWFRELNWYAYMFMYPYEHIKFTFH